MQSLAKEIAGKATEGRCDDIAWAIYLQSVKKHRTYS